MSGNMWLDQVVTV